MQRYKLVLGGTLAGIAGVLAFPTHSPKLRIPSAGASAASNTGATSSSTSGSDTSGSASPDTTVPTTAGASPTTAAPVTKTAARTATSDDQSFRYGDMAVKVTVNGTKITGLSMVALNETDGRSQQIDDYAIPQLEQQVISAGSVNIDGVSGATFTSQAFVDAISNALQKLGVQ